MGDWFQFGKHTIPAFVEQYPDFNETIFGTNLNVLGENGLKISAVKVLPQRVKDYCCPGV